MAPRPSAVMPESSASAGAYGGAIAAVIATGHPEYRRLITLMGTSKFPEVG